MEFVNPAILAGTVLIAAPILLHLIIRQKPKHVLFPALRFLQQRHLTNKRTLRLRHLLLLLLRIAAVALLAISLSRPSLVSSGGQGDPHAPVAVAIVVDTSPRMEYQQDKKSRLDVVKELAGQILEDLPAESEVAVIDSAPGQATFQVDLASARDRVERLTSTTAAKPISRQITMAIQLLKESPLERKEIFLFSDQSKAAWEAEPDPTLPERIAQLPQMGMYFLDVGVERPQNAAIMQLRLSHQILPKNSDLVVLADVASQGLNEQRPVKIFLLDANGKPQLKGEATVSLSPSANSSVEFSLGGLEAGFHHGLLRVVGTDGLESDDTRYFSIATRNPWKVLLVSSRPVEDHVFFLWEAIAPTDHRKNARARFDCRLIDESTLKDELLEEYAAVVLVDPTSIVEEQWKRLGDYVTLGGGLGVFLGAGASPDALNLAAPQQLLPGPLRFQARAPDGDVYPNSNQDQHELMAKFRPLRDSVAWDAFPVFRYWQFESLAQGVANVLSFANNDPFLLERPVGRGRVITATTPLGEAITIPTEDQWNLLATGFEPWPYVMLTNETMLYLVGSSEEKLNYYTNEQASIKLASDQLFEQYLVIPPRGEPFRQSPDPGQNSITFTGTEWPGNYRAGAGGAEHGVDFGFSVNIPGTFSDLERLPQERLTEILGEAKFQLARTPSELDRKLTQGRVGRELFSTLILLLVLVVVGEYFLSNRFYREN